jgi:DNA-binding NarL/FixJ family response regulator
MTETVIYSLIDSPLHPDFSALYEKLGLREIRLTSQRKAMSELKKTRPDYVVADFLYGYGNNYAGINLSNLDVFLRSLQKYAPETKVIVLAEKEERQFVDRLAELFPLHGILVHPVQEIEITALLQS